MNLAAHTMPQSFTQKMREARYDAFSLLMVELSGATTSVSCKEWIKKNYAHSWPRQDERILAVLDAWQSQLQLDPTAQGELTAADYLMDYNRHRTLLFLAQDVAPVIDPIGYDGWELFFSMIQDWQGPLKDLPEVVRSIKAVGQ